MLAIRAAIAGSFIAAHFTALGQTNVLRAWGDNRWNQTNVPPNLTNVVAIAAGRMPGQEPVQIANATNSTLSLTNIQLSSAGTYDVEVSNAFGTNVSVGAKLIVVDAPPFITQPPASSAVTRGFAASLSVGAEGSRPLGYQWQFNATTVSDSTGPLLLHSSAQPSNTGTYQVIVTNHLGAVTSAPVVLEVAPVLFRALRPFTVAAGILPAVEPWLPARRNGALRVNMLATFSGAW